MNSKGFVVQKLVVEIFEDAKKNNQRAELAEAACCKDGNAQKLNKRHNFKNGVNCYFCYCLPSPPFVCCTLFFIRYGISIYQKV